MFILQAGDETIHAADALIHNDLQWFREILRKLLILKLSLKKKKKGTEVVTWQLQVQRDLKGHTHEKM